MNEHTKSGLGEALASYQPSSIAPEVWERFRHEAVRLVVATDPRDEVAASVCLRRLAMFLADVSRNRPDADLSELLTRDYVAGYLARTLAGGTAQGTVANLQGSLNALLRAKQGLPAARRRKPRQQHLGIYTSSELEQSLTAAASDGSPGATAFARTLVAGMTGRQLPSRSHNGDVDVTVIGRLVRASERSWSAPPGLALPTSGRVTLKEVERGRRWANLHGVMSLDMRRLARTALAEVVHGLPAREAVRRGGLGRDGLTALLAGLPPTDEETLRDYLRRPDDAPGC